MTSMTSFLLNSIILTSLVSAYGLRSVGMMRNRERYNSTIAAQELRDCLGENVNLYDIDEVDGLGLDVSIKEYRDVDRDGIDKLVHDCWKSVTKAAAMQVTPNAEFMQDEEDRLWKEYEAIHGGEDDNTESENANSSCLEADQNSGASVLAHANNSSETIGYLDPTSIDNEALMTPMVTWGNVMRHPNWLTSLPC